MIPAVRRAIASVDRNLPVRDIVTLGVLLERGLSIERLVARLAGLSATLALVLAGVGLYGVLAYSVSRRTNEIGVRLALGATPAGVTWSVLRDSLATLAAGLGAGIVLWFPTLGLTQRLVYGVSPHDPATLAVAAALLFLVGALAGLVPALRASRIDPIRAIRAE
jgi:ABC-type antimicrobial peptide transport system permease subunit